MDVPIAPIPEIGRPHVLVLGAGASLAAFPNGDKRGIRLPLMNNLVEVLELGPLLDDHEIEHRGVNFETLYSRLVVDGKHSGVVRSVEQAVFNYFGRLRLPDHPTLYDHLVLSLRPKDFIATFNWDPFLEQAIQRNYVDRHLKPPRFTHLHGCVSLAYCDRHQPLTFGRTGIKCKRCGEPTLPMHLLFPVTKKDYNADPHCVVAWHDVKMVLGHALLFTAFGYGAPSTDVEAVSLLRKGWGEPEGRRFEETEIIDIREEDDLLATWTPFIHSHHYDIRGTFYESWAALHPRRSCEALWNEKMMCEPEEERPIPVALDFPELWNWYEPLLRQEREHDATRRDSAGHEFRPKASP